MNVVILFYVVSDFVFINTDVYTVYTSLLEILILIF